jgi:hypothetical protein
MSSRISQRMRRRQPSVGRIVHHVSHGTAGSEYSQECHAAIVTEVAPDGRTVGLCVLNPDPVL